MAESIYLINCREEWIGRFVLFEGNRFQVVGVVQISGFKNPAHNFDFDLILEGGTQVSRDDVEPEIEDELEPFVKLAQRWLALLRERNEGPALAALEEEILDELRLRRKKKAAG